MGFPPTIVATKAVHRAGSMRSGRRYVQGELPLPQFTNQAEDDLPGGSAPYHWDDGGAGGSFIPLDSDGVSVYYIPPNRTQDITITLTDATDVTDTYSLSVIGTFPVYPQKGYGIEYDEETKTKSARDGTLYFAEPFKPQITWKIGMDRRVFEELKEVWDFLVFHSKIKQFWIYDEERKIMNLVRRVSAIPSEFTSANSWTSSVICRGDAAPIDIVPEISLFRINCGGFATGEYQDDQFFTDGLRWTWDDPTIDFGGVMYPDPPAEVFNTCRYAEDSITYLITGLIPGETYYVYTYLACDPLRQIQITINGVAGGRPESNSFVVYDSKDTGIANAEGELSIVYTRLSGVNVVVSAIMISNSTLDPYP